MNRDGNLICLVGPSGVGKTTYALQLRDKYGYKVIESYTDRPRRYENEEGHIFVTRDEFDAIRDQMVAYTLYPPVDGYQYGVTADLIDACDIYVVDPPGVKELLQKYHGHKRIRVIGLWAEPDELAARMEKRGDSPEQIQKRLAADGEWFDPKKTGLNYDKFIHAAEMDETVEAIAAYLRSINRGQGSLTIYQINPRYDTERLRGLNAEQLKRKQQIHDKPCVNFSVYDAVWSGSTSFADLDELFALFNADGRPDATKYRSLSVSDIVEVTSHENRKLEGRWFCDSFGWRKLSSNIYIDMI